MPRLPQVVPDNPRTDPRTAQRSLGVAEAPGQALARLGQDIAGVGSEIFTQEQQLWQGRQVMEKTAEAAVQSRALYDQILNDPNIQDPDLAKTMQEGFKILHDRIGKDIKDPAVRFQYDEHFTRLTTGFAVDAIDQQRKRLIDHSIAASEMSLDALAKEVPTATSQRLDGIMSIAEGFLAHDVAIRSRTEAQATGRLQKFRKEAYTAHYDEQIRNDPGQAFTDLQKDTFLDPVEKEYLINKAQGQVIAQANQAINDQKAAEAEVAKQRTLTMNADITNSVSSAMNGTYTHPQLEDLRLKYNDHHGEPLPDEKYRLLFDLINKPQQQDPSDPQTLATMNILVNSMNPPPLAKLDDLHHRGLLNLNDYSALSVDVEKNRKSLFIEGLSHNGKVIDDEYGGDREIHANALKDLFKGASLKQIEDKYAAAYKTNSDFKSSQTAYESALQQRDNWNSGHFWGPLKAKVGGDDPNPHNDQVLRKQEQFIKAAKTAHKFVGDADPGDEEGKIYTDANGVNVMAVGGKYIAQ